MKAAFAIAVTALALVVLQLGGASTMAAGPVTAGCAWQRQSERVVKRVHRHGRVRKVVRRRNRWICKPVATPAPAPEATPAPSEQATPSAAPSPPPAPLPGEPEPEANRLAVKSFEHYFILSRPKVRAGELTIELNNQGEDPHNLNVRREGSEGEPLLIPETASLQRSTAYFDLPSGTYRLWCSLPEHEELGMQTTLVVE
ncbi:MAG TPA: hypothetical protein VF504_03370 [Solirubrobacterales bacterium]